MKRSSAKRTRRHCSAGVKKGRNGQQHCWYGYKLHLDVADGQIPVSCVLTAASLHDSQVAVPLATITAERVTSFYDLLMDSAYDAAEIRDHSRSLGHVPIFAPNPSTVPIPNGVHASACVRQRPANGNATRTRNASHAKRPRSHLPNRTGTKNAQCQNA
jgi:hypothetical protein